MLRAVLKLEAIGDDTEQVFRQVGYSRQRAWCAEIVGRNARYGFERRFLKGRKDYSEANSVGSRGVYLYYFLEPGKVYEVSSPASWNRTDRYFAAASNGEVVVVGKDYVEGMVDQ